MVMASFSIRQRFLSLMIFFVTLVLIYGAWSFRTLHQLKVNGPVYNEVVQNKDLIADILPPPVYIIESYLVSLEMSQANQAETSSLKARLEQLKSEYQTRVQFWRGEQLPADFNSHLADANKSAEQFYQIALNELVPAREAQQNSDAIISKLREQYQQHRRAIDQVVNLANQRVKQTELHASETIASASRGQWVLLLLAVTLAMVAAFAVLSSILQPLHRLRDMMLNISDKKDLTLRLNLAGNDELASTAKAFDNLLQHVQQMLHVLRDDASQVSLAASEMHQQAQLLVRSAETAQHSASAINSTLQHSAEGLQSVSAHGQSAMQLSAHSGELSASGAQVITSAANALLRIAEAIRQNSDTISSLDNHTKRISSVVQVIGEVAGQTNLLALNAAIEAARAGESGRGFAVVADEVRTLAGRTATATTDITAMIHEVQNTALKAVESMQHILEQADHGANIAKDAGTAIASIQTETSRVVVAVEGIAKNLQQQEGDSEILLQTAAEVRNVANNNTEVAQLTVSAAAKMSALAKDMHQEVDAWRI